MCYNHSWNIMNWSSRPIPSVLSQFAVYWTQLSRVVQLPEARNHKLWCCLILAVTSPDKKNETMKNNPITEKNLDEKYHFTLKNDPLKVGEKRSKNCQKCIPNPCILLAPKIDAWYMTESWWGEIGCRGCEVGVLLPLPGVPHPSYMTFVPREHGAACLFCQI